MRSVVPKFLFFYKFRNVFQAAVKDPAELVKGKGVDISVFAQPVQLPAADAVFFYELVLGDLSFF